jgi:hypothetical protein
LKFILPHSWQIQSPCFKQNIFFFSCLHLELPEIVLLELV